MNAGGFDYVMTSLILITIANGIVHGSSPVKFPTKPTEV